MITPEEVRTLMQERGITAYQISKMSGISESTISRFFNTPKRSIRLDTLETILDKLGCDLVIKKRPGRKPTR